MKEFFEKNYQQITKMLEEMKKYYTLIVLGYQSIIDKYEPAHESICIHKVILYTYMHSYPVGLEA